ncbi:unnamed protein product, partial [Choristocarpus tenellus]
MCVLLLLPPTSPIQNPNVPSSLPAVVRELARCLSLPEEEVS